MAKIRRWNSPRAKPPFKTLKDMMNLRGFLCCIEDPYGFQDYGDDIPRTKDINYGHVVGAVNGADKNEWDIVFPGHKCALNLVVCDEVIGYIHDGTGNHKLIGRCYDAPDFDEAEFDKQLKAFAQKRRNIYDDGTCIKLFKEIESHFTEY